MDRKQNLRRVNRLVLAMFVAPLGGCVANPIKAPSVWDKLAIPQATAFLRDSTINRFGNFPKLEKKPPLLKIADPENLKAEKPEALKTAAKIKQDQDLKKQKIKAIKFLAGVNCGCYNKDDQVVKAFLESLADCDPDVRMAAVEGLTKAAGNCAKCKNRCQPNCCTEDILKKVQEIASGTDETGCCKEPVAEIREAAKALLCACPCPPAKPIEEIPAPPPSETEEIPGPPAEKPIGEGDVPPTAPQKGEGDTPVSDAAFRMNDDGEDFYVAPVIVAKRDGTNRDKHRTVAHSTTASEKPTSATAKSSTAGEKPSGAIANPEALLHARVIQVRKSLGEVLVEFGEVYQISSGWTMVLVDASGNQHVGRITDTSGRRVLVALESTDSLVADTGKLVRIGRVRQ